jgi:uncharacterized membrane protein (UPF0127 family)
MLKIKARYLKTFLEKTRGLTGLTEFSPVFFNTHLGIHTFGMKAPIDVFILDNDFKVVKIKRGLLPGRVYFWNPKYNNVLETPVGLIKKFNKIKITF